MNLRIFNWTGSSAKSARELTLRTTGKIDASVVGIVFWVWVTAIAVFLAVQIANILLLPLRVYLTRAVTISVIDECQFKQYATFDAGHVNVAYLVRTRGSSDLIPIWRCDPKVSGSSVTVIHSEIAGKTVAVNGKPTLIGTYLGLDGAAGMGFVLVIMLGCGLTLYRANTILRFTSTEARSAWVPVALAADRWKSLVKASEVLTDFLFLGLIFVATGIIEYAMFRTALHIHGDTWFSVFAIATLAVIWSPVPLRMITLAWKTYRSPLFQIARNLAAGFLMFGSIRTISKMPQAAEFTSVSGLLAFVVAVLKASIGL